MVDQAARDLGAATVLDYGAGRGTLGTTLAQQFTPLPYTFLEYDPAVEGRELKPTRADLVVCTDVLEHIEPDCLYSVLDDIGNIARMAVFLEVATRPAQKTLADGRNAHLIIESSDWWLKKILYRWKLQMFKEYLGWFLCVGVPR